MFFLNYLVILFFISVKCLHICISLSCRDGLLGDMAEEHGHKPQVASAEEKKGSQDEVGAEEIEDANRDGSHTPSSQQMERPEGEAFSHYEAKKREKVVVQ